MDQDSPKIKRAYKKRDKRDVAERFWKKVAKRGRDECWPWMAAKYSTGYGVLRIDGKNIPAHRVSFALTNALDPEKLVLHTCDVRSCVNPNHLYAGTYSDNIRDAYTRGVRIVEHGEKTSRRPRRGFQIKLTQAKADEIRRLYAETDLSQREIAQNFGISQMSVSLIVTGKRWVRA